MRNHAQIRASSVEVARFAGESVPLLVLMVYRAKNVCLVQTLLRQVHPSADVRLWALDEIVPELAEMTLGCGPGVRFSHLNWLYGARSIKEGSWVVLADDDVFFTFGDLGSTIDWMRRAGLSLAQPGQSFLGWWNFLFNLARPLMIARDTNYVEQGPLIIAEPEFAKLILPLPAGGDMGWGVEARWFRLKDGKFRIGIIDACHIMHRDRAARSYQAGPQMENMQERLSESGMSSIWQLQSVNGRWWKWRRSPPWRRD